MTTAMDYKRGPGRPREFGMDERIAVTREMHLRVAMFAEAQGTSIAAAYRVLVALALDELERTTHG
jgi:hypothetical protein